MSQPQPEAAIATLLARLEGWTGWTDLEFTALEMAEILWLLDLQANAGVEAGGQPETQPPPGVAGEHTESDSTRRSPAPLLPPAAPVGTEPPQRESNQAEGNALPIRVPDTAALQKRRDLARSLRPLMQKVPSRKVQVIDEAATASQIAEERIWSPVMQPGRERWLELAIVIEDTSLLPVWQDTIAELQYFLERHGAFRDVRTWQLSRGSDGSLQLFLKTGLGIRSRPRPPKELSDPEGRRLILLVSDCTSGSWRSGKVPDLLKQWMRQNPVTVLQLLPEPYWDRTALGVGYPVRFRAQKQAPHQRLNSQLLAKGLSTRRSRQLKAAKALQLPIVTLDPQPLKDWATVLAAIGTHRTAGVVLDPAQLVAYTDTRSPAAELTALQRVRRFRGTASPTARRLAGMMAALPVNWSVIRLVQKNLFDGEASALHLAEIFLSGLMRSEPASSNPSQRHYNFDVGVRELLLKSVPISETEMALEEVADEILESLPEDVRDRISADIQNRLGKSWRSFEAFLLPDLPWGDDRIAEMLPFAQITSQVLRTLGGEYAEVAQRLEQTTAVATEPVAEPVAEPILAPVVTFPALEPIEFETVFVELEPENPLQEFEFETATVEVQQTGRIRKTTQVVIHKSRGQAWQYVEPLNPTVGLEMVAIPAGSFQMGSPENEAQRFDWEGPQREVTVPAFFMGKYPVTQAQWRQVAEWPQVARSLESDSSRFKGDHRPVDRVSWLEATEFCARLAQQTGKPYRLPSEAEWEYACRAGTATPFHWGETITTDLANYDGNYTYGPGPKGEYREQTIEVGAFPANAFGLFDLHGNVWEWCEDEWHSNYENAPIDGSAWISETQSEKDSHVLRGGSWLDYPRHCRSAFRRFNAAGSRNPDFGFRVCCSAPRTS